MHARILFRLNKPQFGMDILYYANFWLFSGNCCFFFLLFYSLFKAKALSALYLQKCLTPILTKICSVIWIFPGWTTRKKNSCSESDGEVEGVEPNKKAAGTLNTSERSDAACDEEMGSDDRNEDEKQRGHGEREAARGGGDEQEFGDGVEEQEESNDSDGSGQMGEDEKDQEEDPFVRELEDVQDEEFEEEQEQGANSDENGSGEEEEGNL